MNGKEKGYVRIWWKVTVCHQGLVVSLFSTLPCIQPMMILKTPAKAETFLLT